MGLSSRPVCVPQRYMEPLGGTSELLLAGELKGTVSQDTSFRGAASRVVTSL